MPDNKEHRVDKETNVWRKIEKILGAPSHRIAWKFEEAGKIEALIDFKRFCIENWALEKKVDISKYDNQKITEDEINQIMINAINDGKIEEGREEFSVDKIQDCIENRLNIIFYGCVNPQNNQRITVGKNTLLNVRSMVFFNELLKKDAKALGKLIRLSEVGLKRVAWTPNDRHFEVDEEGFWGTVGEPNPKADYYEMLIVQGLRALEEVKRIKVDKKKIEERIALLYPWADDNERIYEFSEGIWHLDNIEQTLAKFEEEYPRDDLQNEEVYKRIDKSILKCEKELMQCIERLYHVREKKVKL